MFLYDFFTWLGRTTLGTYLNQSTAAFAATESLHIVGLSLVGGAVLVTQLTALGLILKGLAPASIVRTLRPVTGAGLATVVISGVLLVAAGPFKYYTNPLFPVKLVLLIAALLTQRWLHRSMIRSDSSRGPVRTLALSSLLLWTGVVVAGRWLGLI